MVNVMAGSAQPHVSVMLDEALHWLRIDAEGNYVDATAGAGGHALRIAEGLCGGRLLALDRDAEAVRLARQRLAAYPNAQVIQANYTEMGNAVREAGIEKVDGVLIDAGVSSMQIDSAERGFSFQADGPLDMRMDPERGESAKSLLARLAEAEIAQCLRDFGDVAPAGRIARAIVRRRNAGSLNRTSDLAEAVAEALDFVSGVPSETRTVFQAVRMAVNRELEHLAQGLEAAVGVLAPAGRLVVIAFHSGEDRVVKARLRAASRKQNELRPDGRIRSTRPAQLKLLTSKPIRPAAAECASNPRAASARLRAAERLA